eukprot:gene1308-1384_t
MRAVCKSSVPGIEHNRFHLPNRSIDYRSVATGNFDPHSVPQKEKLISLNSSHISRSGPIQLVPPSSLPETEKTQPATKNPIKSSQTATRPVVPNTTGKINSNINTSKKDLPFCLSRLNYESITTFLNSFNAYKDSAASVPTIQEFIAPFISQVLISKLKIRSLDHWNAQSNLKIIEQLKKEMSSDSLLESIQRVSVVKANFIDSDDPMISFDRYVCEFKQALGTLGSQYYPSEQIIIDLFYKGLLRKEDKILPNLFFLELKKQNKVSFLDNINLIKDSMNQIHEAIKLLWELKIIRDVSPSEWWKTSVIRSQEYQQQFAASQVLANMNDSVTVLNLEEHSLSTLTTKQSLTEDIYSSTSLSSSSSEYRSGSKPFENKNQKQKYHNLKNIPENKDQFKKKRKFVPPVLLQNKPTNAAYKLNQDSNKRMKFN